MTRCRGGAILKRLSVRSVLLVFSLTLLALLSWTPTASGAPPERNAGKSVAAVRETSPHEKQKTGDANERREVDEGEEEEMPSSPTRTVRSGTPEVSFGGGHYVVGENEYHRGDLVLFGGSVEVRGEVTGSLVLIGAQAEVSGEVHRDVVGVASRIKVLDSAVIHGDLVNVLGSVDKVVGARVQRQIVDIPFIDLSHFTRGGSFLTFILWILFWIKMIKAAFLFLAIVVLAAIFSDRIAFSAGVLPGAVGKSFLFGLLTWVAVILGCVLMAVTVIGIPFAILAGLAFKLIWWSGIAVVSCAIGREVGRNVFGRSLSFFAATLLGYLLLAVVYLVPIFGGLIMGIAGIIGLGLLTITRLGTRLPGQLPLAVAAASPGALPTGPPPSAGPPYARPDYQEPPVSDPGSGQGPGPSV